MSKTANIDRIEAHVKAHTSGRSATLSFFAILEDEDLIELAKLPNTVVIMPRETSHLVTTEVEWENVSTLRGFCSFELERSERGQDIPKYLPAEVRYHLLVASTAVFEYLADMTS